MNAFHLPSGTRLSHVHLRTADLADILEFYEKVIGMTLVDRRNSGAALAANAQEHAFLFFSESRKAVPQIHRAAPLAHFSICLPTRVDLTACLRRLFAVRYPIIGAYDHGTGASIHLIDPDGNGVELYANAARFPWPIEKDRMHVTQMESKMDEWLTIGNGKAIPKHLPLKTRLGQINLHVADLSETERFFHRFLGFDVVARLFHCVTFFGTADHKLDSLLNTWAGRMQTVENSVGLISYGLKVPKPGAFVDLVSRAQVFGYEAQSVGHASKIRDPNGKCLQLGEASQVQPLVPDTQGDGLCVIS